MVSSRPYLIRAIYDWIVDSGLTPYLLVNAEGENVTVPTEFIQEGRIILNVGPSAVRGLELNNDWVMFSARFNGASMDVSIPPLSVLAIYAKENGRGMVFNEDETDEDDDTTPPDGPDGGGDAPSKGRPSLRVVK